MKPLARKEDLVIQEVGGEILVYDLRTNKAICLNQTSALIWENCDGKKNASEIAHNLEKKLGSNVSEDFVWFAFDQLEKENLLEGNDFGDRFKGLNRREVIRKIGLTWLIALPVVAAIVAPQAAHAQSCMAVGSNGCATTTNNQPNGCACNGNGNCLSGMCVSNCCRA